MAKHFHRGASIIGAVLALLIACTLLPAQHAAADAGDNIIWLPLLVGGTAGPGNPGGGGGGGGGTSGSFRTTVAPTATSDFKSAEFSLWIPDDVALVHGVILYGPGCGASSLGDKPAKERAALAQKWNLAFLGIHFADKAGGKFCGWSYAERSGSAAATLQALQNFAQDAKRPELASAPWLLFGMSGGAGWAMDMAILYPERTIAAFPRSSSSDRGNVAGALGVPIMMSAGEDDGFKVGMEQRFAKYRPQGAVWALAITPNEGHVLGKAWNMAVPFFDAVLQQRLPSDPTAALQPVDAGRAWLGNNGSHGIAPAAAYSGDRATASWLPDEATATLWKRYVDTGLK